MAQTLCISFVSDRKSYHLVDADFRLGDKFIAHVYLGHIETAVAAACLAAAVNVHKGGQLHVGADKALGQVIEPLFGVLVLEMLGDGYLGTDDEFA